ncbi:hypothetical protein AYX14_07181, partial [Cryptococcus neoformans]
MPLTTEPSLNYGGAAAHERTEGSVKQVRDDTPKVPVQGQRHKAASQAHRRQRSSIALPSGT